MPKLARLLYTVQLSFKQLSFKFSMSKNNFENDKRLVNCFKFSRFKKYLWLLKISNSKSRNYGADRSWCFFGRELVAYSNITSDEFFDEISKNFSKSIRGKIRKNLGFTPMPKRDGHVANHPVAGKTGCPVIISKYSQAQKNSS